MEDRVFYSIGAKVLTMYKDRSLIKFRRYFMHAIREGKLAEQAADEAQWKTRTETLAEIEADNNLPDKVSKEAAWKSCLEILTILRLAFVDYDVIYEERKVQGEQARLLLKEQASASIEKTLVEGLKLRVDTEIKDKKGKAND
jgi:hypothetical protein